MSEQRCTISIISQDEASHAGTLKPRLESCMSLTQDILFGLESERTCLENLASCMDDIHLEKNLDEQRLICQAIASLHKIHSRLCKICTLYNIPYMLAPTIPVIRVLSSDLFGFMPDSSQQLCELSTRLGSIVTDSAILTSTNHDFGLSNAESSLLLDEAKLMADSKINKQYPNLDSD